MLEEPARPRAQIWAPLNLKKRQIRLLVLEPCRDINAPLSGRLILKSLDRHPIYDAISHAWGGRQPVLPMSIVGTPISITRSLDSCLRHLRHETEWRSYWIDAICVDQFNLWERAHQVQHMEHIFRTAQTVHVWLGDYRPAQVAVVFDIMNAIGSGVRPNDITIDGTHLTPQHFARLSLFTKSPWFDRLWVKQEVALARSIVFHHCRSQIDMPKVRRFYEDFYQSAHDYMPLLKLGDYENEWYYATEKFSLLLGSSDIFQLQSLSKSLLASSMTALMYSLRCTRVQDARDRIYGLVGIFNALFDEDLVEANYTKTPQEVYTDFAFNFISATEYLTLLYQANKEENSLPALPTWVPDWTSEHDFWQEQVRSELFHNHFNACGAEQMPQPRRESGGTYLCVKASIFGLIGRVGNVCKVDESSPTYRPQILHFLDTSESMFGADSMFTAHLSLARTMLMDVNITSKLDSDEEVLRQYHSAKYTLFINESNEVAEHVIACVSRTRFFITGNGEPALGPPDTQLGDMLAILPGAKVPYVLRPSYNTMQGKLYAFIGPCYVHGVMYGELLQQESFPGFEDIILE